MARRALITGITGQDGSYLAEHLHSHGYEIHGFFRPGEQMLSEVEAGEIHRHEGEIEDASAVAKAVASARPDECYHLAAQTFVTGEELSTIRINVSGTLHVLDALRREAPECRLFLAGSSEMFGDVEVSPQDESTPLRPRNVYGVSKVAAYQLMRVYREQHGLFACCWILVQPRVSASWSALRHPKDHPSGCAHQARQRNRTSVGQSRCYSRLGACSRLCSRHVANAAAARAGRLCSSDWAGA